MTLHWLFVLITAILMVPFALTIWQARRRAVERSRDWLASLERLTRLSFVGTDIKDSEVEQLLQVIEEHINKLNYVTEEASIEYLNSFFEQWIRSLPKDMRPKVERLRSRVFFRLGDPAEKMRSLQFFYVDGIKDDLPFLNEALALSPEHSNIRQFAVETISQVKSRVKHSNDQAAAVVT